jgi:hypothetical protein
VVLYSPTSSVPRRRGIKRRSAARARAMVLGDCEGVEKIRVGMWDSRLINARPGCVSDRQLSHHVSLRGATA